MKNLKHLVDSFGRRIDYLRISLTDICNFRCVYCEPPQGTAAAPRSGYLSLSELERFVSLVGRMGVHRFRLTGGEPTLRSDIIDIVGRLKKIPAVHNLSMTTNGSRLTPLLKALKQSGLDRINISMDSLDAQRFEAITRSKNLDDVYDSVFASLQEGFGVKVNVVILKGLSSSEVLRFVELAVHHPLEVRFLEFMPLCGKGWNPGQFVPVSQIRSIVKEHYGLKVLSREGQVAESYALEGGRGTVGFIGSMTESFCNTCSRFRITASGEIYPCLFSNVHVSVGRLLKENASDDALLQAIRRSAAIKPRGNNYIDAPYEPQRDDAAAAFRNPLIKTIGG